MTDAAGIYHWHPEFRGQSRDHVRATLAEELSHDQRAYDAALDGSEFDEYGAHNVIRDLDKRWDRYHFSWQEADPAELASLIESHAWASDEAERDIPWQEFRTSTRPVTSRSVASNAVPESGAPGGVMRLVLIGLLVLILAAALFAVLH